MYWINFLLSLRLSQSVCADCLEMPLPLLLLPGAVLCWGQQFADSNCPSICARWNQDVCVLINIAELPLQVSLSCWVLPISHQLVRSTIKYCISHQHQQQCQLHVGVIRCGEFYLTHYTGTTLHRLLLLLQLLLNVCFFAQWLMSSCLSIISHKFNDNHSLWERWEWEWEWSKENWALLAG